MRYNNRWMVVILLLTSVLFLGCEKESHNDHVERPSKSEPIPGSDGLHKVTLTQKAMERIDAQTEKVRQEGGKIVVPYSSLIYDATGQTWVYTSPAPRTFIRAKVDVDRIDGDKAFLKSGPAAGVEVASVAVAEIYGSEFQVGH